MTSLFPLTLMVAPVPSVTVISTTISFTVSSLRMISLPLIVYATAFPVLSVSLLTL